MVQSRAFSAGGVTQEYHRSRIEVWHIIALTDVYE